MGRLSDNQVFTLKVKEIEMAFESYDSNQGSGKMFCHKFVMMDPDTSDEFICQWCNDSPKLTEYRAGDILKIQTKKLTRGIHNITPLEKLEFTKPEPKEKVYEPIKPAIKIGEPVSSYPNPNIAGTMIDRAMTNAVTYWKGNEVPFGSVTDIADEILEWYKKQFNSINNAG